MVQPPADAEAQPDGSYICALPDGSSLRYTQRSDGSWRKPEKIRPSQRRAAGDRRAPLRSVGCVAGGVAAANAPRDGGPSPASAPRVYEDLKDVLVGLSTEEEREFLLKIERELTGFIDSDAHRFVFPPMNGHFRRLLHITCRRFGVDSSSSSQSLWGLDKGMEVRRQPWSRTPVLRYTDLAPASCEPEHCVYSFPTDAPPVDIAPETAAAVAGAAAASRRQQLMSRSGSAPAQQRQKVSGANGEDGNGEDGNGGKTGRRRGRGAFQFGAPISADTEPENETVAVVTTVVTTTGEQAATPEPRSGGEVPGRSTGVSTVEADRSEARAGHEPSGHASPAGAAKTGGDADADQPLHTEDGEQENDVASNERQTEQLADVSPDGVAGEAGRDHEPVPSVCDDTDPHYDGIASATVSVVQEIDEEKELRPSQAAQYGRYTAEVRQANAQQWQARGGVDRRTHASLQASMADDATAVIASHATWRLRRPGNGYISLKAKGTAGLSIIFTSRMPHETSQQTRPAATQQQQRQQEQQWLQGGECYYEVRLGQRSDDPAAAAQPSAQNDSGGYIAKYSAAGGMEVLTQQAAAPVRLLAASLLAQKSSR